MLGAERNEKKKRCNNILVKRWNKLIYTCSYLQLTAYHESGHAIVALNTEGAHPIHKATIIPRGSALGMVTQLPSSDETSVSKKQLLARLDVCMGGRVAEELIFGQDHITTGASSDLNTATELAQYMVCWFNACHIFLLLWKKERKKYRFMSYSSHVNILMDVDRFDLEGNNLWDEWDNRSCSY